MTKENKKDIISIENTYIGKRKEMRLIMKNEKGSVTIFVIITIILVVSILMIIYMRVSEQKNRQMQEIDKIQEEYQAENIDQEYSLTINEINNENSRY